MGFGTGEGLCLQIVTFSKTTLTCANPEAASDIVHQDQRNIALILYPLATSKNSGDKKVKQEHVLEDRIIAHKMSMDFDGSIHYDVVDEHGADKRPLSQRFRLGISKNFTKSNVWTKSKIFRGKVPRVPYLRVRDMVKALDPDQTLGRDELDETKLTPEERAAQRGVASWTAIINAVLEGMPRDALSSYTIIDLTPWKYAEVLFTTWSITKSNPTCMLSCMSCFTDECFKVPLEKMMRSKLMDEWWDGRPDAGPRHFVGTSTAVDPPTLKLCRWEHNAPVIPDAVLTRFGDDTAELTEIKKLVAAHTAKYKTQGGNAGGNSDVGPDMTLAPIPKNLHVLVTLESMEFASVEQCNMFAVTWTLYPLKRYLHDVLHSRSIDNLTLSRSRVCHFSVEIVNMLSCMNMSVELAKVCLCICLSVSACYLCVYVSPHP